MHFCYGLGAFVSPMIAEPFLLNQDCTSLIDNTTITEEGQGMGGHHHHMVIKSNDSMVATTLDEAQHMTQVKYAFWIMALLLVSYFISFRFSLNFAANAAKFNEILKSYFM